MALDINKYKNQMVNIVIIALSLIIANNIHKAQNRIVESLRAEKEEAIKKGEVLAEINQLEKKIDVYKKGLTKKDASVLINNINNLARESDIKIVSLRPQEEKDYPAYIQYSFSMVISALDYHQVGKFVSKLESSPDIYTVDSLNLRPSTGEVEGVRPSEVTADLILSTIFFKG